MKSQKITSISLWSTLSIYLLAVCWLGATSITAQSPSDEREFKDETPTHLPIKVKIKDLQKVKNLENEKWIDDLEIEVANTSQKPIYYLDFMMILPEVMSSDGNPIGFPFRYGRSALVSFDTELIPEDVPIQPGEKYTLKLPERDLRGWNIFASKRNLLRSEPKKIRLMFQIINFGDGTGFMGSGGTPIPNTSSAQAYDDRRDNSEIMASADTRRNCPPRSLFQRVVS